MESPSSPQYVHRLCTGFTQVMHTVVHSFVAEDGQAAGNHPGAIVELPWSKPRLALVGLAVPGGSRVGLCCLV